MTNAKFNLLVFLVFLCQFAVSQKEPVIIDKQGTFKTLTRTDYISSGCTFSKTDMTANFQEITRIIELTKQTPVIIENLGFMGFARLRPVDCKDDAQYGIPAELSFEFADFFYNKNGEITYNTIEPPSWKMITNRLVPVGYMFYSDRFSRNPDFFTVPEKKETIAPGIDLYSDECVVIYDYNRPDYWLPVTVKEAFDFVFAKNNALTNKIQREMALEMLNGELAAIPREDWDKPATLSGMLSRVGTQTGFPKIMKVNPQYWNTNRPKSDIQFIYFQMVTNKDYLNQRVEDSKKYNGLGSSFCRFEASLDFDYVQTLLPLISR